MNDTQTAVGRVLEAAASEALFGSTDTAGAARYLALGVSTLEKLRVKAVQQAYGWAERSRHLRLSRPFGMEGRAQAAEHNRHLAVAQERRSRLRECRCVVTP
jgi:hypothetical protein